MIDLYAMVSPNVQKIYLMLEETGLEYQPHQVNIWKGEQFAPEFLALNPNAKVPVIIDREGPDGEEHVVFESGAILIYLAEKTGAFLPADGRARHQVLQWLMVQLTGIGPMFGQFNHFCRFAPDNAYAVSRYTTEAARLYRLIADIATFPWFRTQSRLFGETRPFMKIDGQEHPHLWRWFQEIAARPAVQKALEVIDAHPSTLATATPEELDRVFGRGRHAHGY